MVIASPAEVGTPRFAGPMVRVFRHLLKKHGLDDMVLNWGSPGFVDTDQGFTMVTVRAEMNCCS